jgi:large subunit ribosomal protein L18
MENTYKPTMPTLAASITKAASKQSYYTIRFLVDRDRMDDAYRAYAYFRWVDDIIDDGAGLTLASASTKAGALKGQLQKTGNRKAAEAVGEAIAKQATGVGIKCVCFDRNRYKYHGRVKAFADGAREGGLKF